MYNESFVFGDSTFNKSVLDRPFDIIVSGSPGLLLPAPHVGGFIVNAVDLRVDVNLIEFPNLPSNNISPEYSCNGIMLWSSGNVESIVGLDVVSNFVRPDENASS